MIFKVEQAKDLGTFEEYGLKTIAGIWNGNKIVYKDISETDYKTQIYTTYSEIEINTLGELLDFKNNCGNNIVIALDDNSDKYTYKIIIYNSWLE